jgi:hypothetical protein
MRTRQGAVVGVLGRPDPQRGAVAVAGLFLLFAAGAVIALSFNVGHLMAARVDLQSAADSAALGAAVRWSKELTLEPSGPDLGDALTQAEVVAAAHKVLNETVLINHNDRDVTFGTWFDPDCVKPGGGSCCEFGGETPCFKPLTTTQVNNSPGSANAIMVSVGKDAAAGRNTAVPLYFRGFFDPFDLRPDVTSKDVTARAIALLPGSGFVDECPLPLGIPRCALMLGSACSAGAQPDDVRATYFGIISPSAVDTMGFVNLDGPTNTSNFVEDLEESECTGTANDSQANVGNGNNIFSSGSQADDVVDAFVGLRGTRRCLLGATSVIPVLAQGCQGVLAPSDFYNEGTMKGDRDYDFNDGTVLGFVRIKVTGLFKKGNGSSSDKFFPYSCGSNTTSKTAAPTCNSYNASSPGCIPTWMAEENSVKDILRFDILCGAPSQYGGGTVTGASDKKIRLAY